MNKAGTFLAVGVAVLALVSCSGKEPKSVATAANAPVVKAFEIRAPSAVGGTIIQSIGQRRINQSNALVYRDGILLLGGGYMEEGIYRDRNDVLWSPDGRKWQNLAESLFSPERNQYAGCVLQNRIAIVGGKDTQFDIRTPFVDRADAFLFDPNAGSTPSSITGLPPRETPALISRDEEMLVVGGSEKGGPVSSVFVVKKGKATAHSSIQGVEGLLVSVQGWSTADAYYITDGEGDFWKSVDGLAWQKLQTDKRFKNRSGYVVIPRGTEWYLAGGDARLGEDLSGLANDVWKSTDEGKTWTLLTGEAGPGYMPSTGAGALGHYKSFPAREQAAGLLLKGRLVIGGGKDGSGDRQDFWTSEDGISWEELK
jgi:hypothetical protein